jgi:hypothetical protein
MYVPLLPYLTASLSWIARADPAYVYKLLTAALACLGPSTMYLFVRYFTRSRGWAVGAAVAYTFFSPLYGLVRQIDADRGRAHLPWHLHVLTKYGEGPHNAGLTMLPLAWIATWSAATQRGYWRLFACAVLFAAITLTNWVAGLALAFGSAMLLLAAWRMYDGSGFRPARPIAAAALAYLLACFWLTHTFVSTIAFNWPADAFNYKLRVAQWQLMGGFAAGIAAVRLLAWRYRWPFYETFVALCVFGFGYVVVIYYSYGIDMLPESRRYALEFEAFVILAVFAFLRFCFAPANEVRLFAGVVVLAGLLTAGLPQVHRYLVQGWNLRRPVPVESTTEYRVAQQLANLRPSGRVLASGGLRFRLNAWTDLQQVGGAFESGLRNRTPVHFAYHIRTGQDTAPELVTASAVMEMKALGVEYLVVHGPKSQEHYRDYKDPQRFESVLERVAASGDVESDDIIYRVPFRGFAHALKPDELPARAHREALPPYIAAIEDPARAPLRTMWAGPRDMEVSGAVPRGMLVALQVTHDDGWQAWQDGKPVALARNALGFMNVLVSPAQSTTIRLHYGGTVEQRLMFVISAIAWIWALIALRRTARRYRP